MIYRNSFAVSQQFQYKYEYLEHAKRNCLRDLGSKLYEHFEYTVEHKKYTLSSFEQNAIYNIELAVFSEKKWNSFLLQLQRVLNPVQVQYLKDLVSELQTGTK